MTNIDTRSSGLESLSENLGLMSQAKEKNNSLHMLSKIQNEIKSEDIHHQCPIQKTQQNELKIKQKWPLIELRGKKLCNTHTPQLRLYVAGDPAAPTPSFHFLCTIFS